MCFPSRHLFFLGLALAATVARAAMGLDGLVSNSPFVLQQSESVAPVVTESSAVEFRGVIATQDGVVFGLYDRTRNLSAWVRQNEPGAEFAVRAYDSANDMVTLDYKGQKLTLQLSSSKIGQADSSAVPISSVTNQAGVTLATNKDDQRRLESVVAEVRRRRALRQAATSAAQPAAVPAP